MDNNGIYSGFSTWGTNQSIADPDDGCFDEEIQIEPEFCNTCADLLASDEHTICTICIDIALIEANYDRKEPVCA